MSTIGQTAQYLATHDAAALLGPGEGWSRSSVQETVTRLMRDHLRINKFGWDQEFVRDLGVD